MHGPTLTMPTASFESNPTFPRSHSSSNIPVSVTIDYKEPTIQNDELPRSASFSTLPTLDGSLEYIPEGSLQRLSSAASSPALPLSQEEDTTPYAESTSVREGKSGNRLTKEAKEEKTKAERVGRRKSLVARPKSWIQKVKGSPETTHMNDMSDVIPSDVPPVPEIPKVTRDKTKTVSESFANFARKSWISSSSRSPSPSSRNLGKEIEHDGRIEETTKMTTTILTPVSRAASIANDTLAPPKATDGPARPTPARRASTFQKIRQRPQSVLANFHNFTSTNSSTSSLPASSIDNRSTPRTSTDKVPPLPNFSNEKLPGVQSPKKRDELWSAFRSLENDFSKFQSKSLSLKTNVVRSSLLPFLRNHVNHPSNSCLRAEDIDRRINILNKWWLGLLEVLDGRQNQVVSGVDRPVLLEAVVMIMTRPEWRLGPSQFAPLYQRSPNRSPDRGSVRAKKSSSSLNSSASQFLAESVYHNVRNLFIQNLTTQMNFVVNKMSLRHAPASLVTFCGKAAAYAFFFVPGIAEILVRIWKLPPDTIKRVADELGLPKRQNKTETEEITARFPPHIRALGWTSVMTVTNQLRQTPLLSILVSKIPWYGPWIARWCGRDSDLFYVFSKHYHILAGEFLPSELSLATKARAPGFVLVHAQILTALDATIHRQPAPEQLPLTFDDVLAGADASAAALPLPSTNATRLMAENRLIMLLRDFLSERPGDFELARITFAESFSKMMQASARRTSLFDHNACFVLCDFMDEALSLFVRFHHFSGFENDFIDWHFWLDVCKKMLESQNSMSEIRLFAFLFCAWNVITSNESRKEILCLEWLLTEETFDKFFNHWCPMVRAYYMRLLCWRLCREDGEVSDLDTKIFSVVSSRIRANWGHYLFIRQTADIKRLLPPSTTPCHPAPGRRLLIIRNDNQMPSPNLFLGFDGLVNSTAQHSGMPTKPSNAYKRQSLIGSKVDTAALETNENELPKPATEVPPITPSKKRWTFMGKMIPSLSTSPESSSTPKFTTSKQALEDARKETAIARARPTHPSKTGSSGSDTPPQTSNHRAYSFKFSLEWTQHFEKAQQLLQNGTLGGNPQNHHPHGERRLSVPRLPAPAQAWLGARVPNANREVIPQDPALEGRERGTRAKYAGRALAEWGQVVGECNNFVDRRRAEGVPTLRWVEVPTLGVEGFRKFAG